MTKQEAFELAKKGIFVRHDSFPPLEGIRIDENGFIITLESRGEINSYITEYSYSHQFYNDGWEEYSKIESVPESQKEDKINPRHYRQFSVEVIDMMIAIWGKEAVIKHCEMTAFAYKMKAGHKDCLETDINKSKWYLDKANELSIN